MKPPGCRPEATQYNTIRPTLHHGPALVEILGAVIGSPDGIVRFVGKLALDHVRSKTHFVKRVVL